MFEPMHCECCGRALRSSTSGWSTESHWVLDSWEEPGYWTCDPEDFDLDADFESLAATADDNEAIQEATR